MVQIRLRRLNRIGRVKKNFIIVFYSGMDIYTAPQETVGEAGIEPRTAA
jgi:hypothetical protein